MGGLIGAAAGLPSSALIVGCGVGLVGAVVLALREGKRLTERNDELLRRLEEGRVDEAIEGYTDVARTSRSSAHRSVALANLAVALGRRGDHERAMSVLALCEKEFKPAAKRAYGQHVALTASHFVALLGDHAGADLWLAEAKKRGVSRALLETCWTSFIAAMRRNEFQLALDEISSRWARLEATTNAASMRRIRVLRAFALHQVGRKDEVDAALEGTRPFAAHDYAGLATEWPELRAFLVDHQLVSQQAA